MLQHTRDVSQHCVYGKVEEFMLFGVMAMRKGWDTTDWCVLQTSIMQATEHCLCSQACKRPVVVK